MACLVNCHLSFSKKQRKLIQLSGGPKVKSHFEHPLLEENNILTGAFRMTPKLNGGSKIHLALQIFPPEGKKLSLPAPLNL